MVHRILVIAARVVAVLAFVSLMTFLGARSNYPLPAKTPGLGRLGVTKLRSRPVPAEPVLLVIGDSGSGTPEFHANIDAMAKEDAWCAVHTGDVSYSGPTEFGRFLQQAERLPFPLLAVAGDHDEIWDPGLDKFDRYIGDPGNWFFDADHVRMIFLDTIGEDISKRTLDFLELALGDPDRPKKTVVVTHTPPFQPNLRYPRSLGKGHAIHSAERARRMIDLLAKARVSLLACGHWHAFEYTDIAGFPLVISGGGGKHVEEGHVFHYVRVTLSDPIKVEMVETSPRERARPVRWAFDKSVGTWLRIGGAVSGGLFLLWALLFAGARATRKKESEVQDDA